MQARTGPTGCSAARGNHSWHCLLNMDWRGMAGELWESRRRVPSPPHFAIITFLPLRVSLSHSLGSCHLRREGSCLRTALCSPCSSTGLPKEISSLAVLGNIFIHCSHWRLLLAFQKQSNKINVPSPCMTHGLLASLCCNFSPNAQPASLVGLGGGCKIQPIQEQEP